jgi:hypothetical protein
MSKHKAPKVEFSSKPRESKFHPQSDITLRILDGRSTITLTYKEAHELIKEIERAKGVACSVSQRPFTPDDERRIEGFLEDLERRKKLRDPVGEILDAGFRELAKKAHPDAGGTKEAMQVLNAARREARRRLRL